MALRAVTPAEIPGILAATCEHIEPFNLGFLKIISDEKDAVPAGSGTLVTAAGAHAIVTAGHVLDALPSRGEFGLVFPIAGAEPRLHRHRIAGDTIQKVALGNFSYDRNGPDLGLLILRQPDVAKLEATKNLL